MIYDYRLVKPYELQESRVSFESLSRN